MKMFIREKFQPIVAIVGAILFSAASMGVAVGPAIQTAAAAPAAPAVASL